ncbi:MAG: protein phosphatase 2C domain-containing protein [Nitrospirae bacterium]|nr:protein phosphatase 2C domain-containing protein [Nitrospirota bacterium]
MSILSPYIFGASITGSLHIKEDLPCQDACHYEIVDEFGLIAVADGLGSVPFSDIGSRLAVEAAVSSAKNLLLDIPDDGLDISEIPLKMLHAARECLENRAIEDGLKLTDMATTLLAVLFFRDTIYAAQIGDGAVVAKVGGELVLISGPLNSEYANEVTPITSSTWQSDLYIAEALSGAECVAVFTDGCQRAALLKTMDGYTPFEKFFNPVFSFASETADLIAGEQELSEFLLSEKISEYSEDDKTLVLAVLQGLNND